MKCEKCGENQAVVHITKNINGKVTELYVCEDCAKKMNVFDDSSIIDTADFLSSFFSPLMAKKTVAEPVCQKCGTSLKSFTSSGLLGCSYCYEQFKDSLEPMIRRMHGKTEHVGKIPKGFDKSVSAAKEYNKLSEMLKEAIEEERYEDAAKIRDSIKKMTDNQ